MSRGGSYGGGHSSLGYLFSSDDPPSQPTAPKSPYTPPYGIDTEPDEKRPNRNLPASPKQNVSTNNYHRAQGQNTGNFITERPSTKVKSAPGGDSSLGFLFGDNGMV